jgi:hypothetical protein
MSLRFAMLETLAPTPIEDWQFATICWANPNGDLRSPFRRIEDAFLHPLSLRFVWGLSPIMPPLSLRFVWVLRPKRIEDAFLQAL